MPELSKHELCTGCTACAAVCPKNCIDMTADANGFFYPKVDEASCIGCGLCEKTCPVLKKNTPAHVPTAFAAHSLDTGMRLESSSGGVFSEMSRVILAHGGAICGAAYDDRFRVVHIFAETEEDLSRLRGAKYAQSDLNDIFPAVKSRLNAGQQVLFSGAPCQIAGLKTYLSKDYENLFTVDFICHSIPSPLAWREYIKYRSTKDNGGELPTAINLRSKVSGWSRYQYSNLFEYSNGITHTIRSGESLYMKLFVGGYISRKSCDKCQFKGYSRVSDLTLGDFWGIWDIAPEMDDNNGTSIVLIQTDKGAKLLEEISNQLNLKSVTLEEACRQNPAILNSKQSHNRRTKTFELIRNGRINECEDWFIQKKPSVVQMIRNTISRILSKR